MSSIPPCTDTKINIPSSQGIAYHIGNLDVKRDAVLDDFAPSIPELDIDTFMTSFLPPLSALPTDTEDIIIIIQKLMESKDILIDNSNPDDPSFFWSAFSTDPASSGCKENDTFAGLDRIYGAIMRHAPRNLQATSKLVLNPNCAPYSQRTYRTRPDGYMLLNKTSVENGKSDVHYWEDLAMTMEFKKRNSNSDCSDNMKKQVFSMHQVMAYHPCQRFTFGLTIENTDARLWFCSRSAMIVSEKVNFNKMPAVLIVTFLTFTFASKSDLGWDDTMTPILVEENIQYEIKVGNRTYRTVDVLSNFAAHMIVGRATRVFLVRDTVSQKKFVLKDAWLAKGRKMEHEVQHELLNDIQEKLNELEMKEVQRHLFTPEDHCIVQIQVNGNAVNDETETLIMRKVDLSNARRLSVMDSIREPHIVKAEGHTSNTSEHVNTRATKPNPEDITHRYHYRIVYKEHATPLYEVKALSLVMMTLDQLVKVLNIFHRAGWVHRDISGGNVFLLQPDLVFKLGDLEFAKKIGKDGEHDVRTTKGTLDFMSTEVEAQTYMYLPDSSNVEFFYHNSLHELESVWWLATWTLFFHYPVERAAGSLDGQKAAINTLFPRLLPSYRHIFISVPQKFETVVESLHVVLHPYGKKLDDLRVSLIGTYKNFEVCLGKESSIEHIHNFSQNLLDGIHDIFRSTFQEMEKELNSPGKDVQLIRLHNVKEDVKRKHSSTEPEPDNVQGKHARITIGAATFMGRPVA